MGPSVNEPNHACFTAPRKEDEDYRYFRGSLVLSRVRRSIVTSNSLPQSFDHTDDDIAVPPTIPENSEGPPESSSPRALSPPVPSGSPSSRSSSTQSRSRPKSADGGEVRAADKPEGLRLDLELSEPNLVAVKGANSDNVGSLTNAVSLT